MTNEEILYSFYLNSNIKQRNEAIEYLNNRDFNSLVTKTVHYYNRKTKEIMLNSRIISEVIKELNLIKFDANETEPVLSTWNTEDGTPFSNPQSGVLLESCIYTIVPEEKCHSLAKNYTSSAMWKIKYQPEGRDTKRYLEIIANYKKDL